MKMNSNGIVGVLALVTLLGGLCRGGPDADDREKNRGGPICHLKLDEGAGDTVRDSSGNDAHGSVIRLGENSQWVQGRLGTALALTGLGMHRNGGVKIPGLGCHDFSGGLTVQAWVKPTMNPEAGAPQNMIASTINGSRGPGFRFQIFAYKDGPSGEMIFGFSGGKEGTGGGVTTHPKRMLRKGTWYHVAAVYDGSRVTLFVDGEKIAASKPGIRATPGAADLTIGSYGSGTAYGWNGIIDEVKIYDYPRTASDLVRDGSSLFELENPAATR